MAQQLFIDGQQIGDHFLSVQSVDQALTPPARRTGLFQDTAAVNSESRNLLHARVFSVSLVRQDSIKADEAISLIQEMQGLTVDIEIKDGSTILMSCLQWTIDNVTLPTLPPGFAGRFAERIDITAIGESAPSYP